VGESSATYTQAFIYRVPKKNHEAFAEAEGKLAAIFKKHGISGSRFLTLTPAKIFPRIHRHR
jgi:hypothetical protein